MSNYESIKDKSLPESRKELVDELIEHLKSGQIPWHKTWLPGQRAHNAVTGKEYRGINLLSIAMRPFSDPRWCTFNQAKEKGWFIKKGSKGTPIEVFKNIDKRTNKEIAWDKIEKEIKDFTHEEQQAFLKENIRTFIKGYRIFNAEQINGIPALEQKPLSEEEKAKQNAVIEGVIELSEAKVFYNGNGRNFYLPDKDEIHLCERGSFDSIESFYAIALHEIGHSTGHSSRLNRDLSGHFGTQKYAKEELRAELGSMFTHQELGIGLSEELKKNHAAYIQNWISILKEKPAELFHAITDANKIAKYICTRARVLQNSQGVQELPKNLAKQADLNNKEQIKALAALHRQQSPNSYPAAIKGAKSIDERTQKKQQNSRQKTK